MTIPGSDPARGRSSLKDGLCIAVFLAMAAAVLVCFLVPPNQDRGRMEEKYGRAAYKFIGSYFPDHADLNADPNVASARIGRRIVRFLEKTGLYPAHRSAWFRIVAALFAAACLWTHAPGFFKRKGAEEPPGAGTSRATETRLNLPPKAAGRALRAVLEKRGYWFRPEADGGTVRFAAKKGGFSRWASGLAMFGIAAALTGFVQNARGMRETRAAASADRWFELKELGAAIRLESVQLEFGEDGKPTLFEGELEIREKNGRTESKRFSQNRPPRWRGRLIHPIRTGVYSLTFLVDGPDGRRRRVEASPDETREIGQGMPAVVYSSGEVSLDRRGPAAFIQYIESGRVRGLGWVGADRAASLGRGSVRVESIAPWVLFSFRRDPGKMAVFAGSALFLTGVAMARFFPIRRFEGAIEAREEGSGLRMTGFFDENDDRFQDDWTAALLVLEIRESAVSNEASGNREVQIEERENRIDENA